MKVKIAICLSFVLACLSVFGLVESGPLPEERPAHTRISLPRGAIARIGKGMKAEREGAIACSPDEEVLATGGDDGTVLLWDLERNKAGAGEIN